MKRWLLVIFSVLYISAYAGPGPHFVANRNQWPRTIRFAADVSNGNILFLRDRIRFAFQTPVDRHNIGHGKPRVLQPAGDDGDAVGNTINGHIYDVTFIGANTAEPEGENQLTARYNYFVGNDRSQWASGVPAYEGVRYNNLYHGIDMRYYNDGEHIKYEWIVSPQGDANSIRMRYEGIDQLSIEEGRLHLKTSVNEVWELEPYAYQWKNGVKIHVPCAYSVRNNEVSYSFPEGYDECETLIIDPVLIFSAYSGSTADNWGNAATYDEHGNVYSGGMVDGVQNPGIYPVTPGAYKTVHSPGKWDIGILKYDSSGAQLLYCTFLGGSDTETPQSLVVNAAGELLVMGATGSSDFPVSNGSKFHGGDRIDPMGGVVYNNGTDLFVARLSEDGSALMGATYLGGAENDAVNFVSGFMTSALTRVESPLARNYGDPLRGDIITDDDNYVYLASNTLSGDFPIQGTGTVFNGGSGSRNHDAVVVKLTPDLSSIVWSRYIGGSETDAAYSIKLDSQKHIFVAGGTNSAAIAGMNGFHVASQGDIDGWVMSLDNSGNVLNGTFIGTSKYDQCYFVDLNALGDVVVYGQTRGSYPVTSGVYSNPQAGQFIQKLDNTLHTPGFSTVVGKGNNSPDISPTAFLVSDCGYIYISGWGGRDNDSTDIDWGDLSDPFDNVLFFHNYVGGDTDGLPITPDAYQQTTSGSDFYFMALTEDASRFLYGTFLGGGVSATHVDGGTSRFDKHGIVYHAVCAGCGGVSDFPAVNVPPAHQLNGSVNCNNAVFKFDLSLLKAYIQTNSVKLDMPGLNVICIPDKILFENLSSGGTEFVWDLGDGTRLTRTDKNSVIHQYQAPGHYRVWLKALDPQTCRGKDSVSVVVHVYNAEAEIQGDDAICLGTPYRLKASGGATYSWKSADGSFVSTEASPAIAPKDTTVYYVTVTEASGCMYRDTVRIGVVDPISPDFEIERHADCLSTPSVSVKNLTDSLRAGDRVFFDFGDGTTADNETVEHLYEKDGLYTVKLVAVREFCVTEKSVTMPFMTLNVPNVITPGSKDGRNDHFDIRFGQQPGATPGDYGFKVSLVVYNRWGTEVYKADDYKYDWAGEGLAAGIYYYEVVVEGHAHCKSWIQIIR